MGSRDRPATERTTDSTEYASMQIVRSIRSLEAQEGIRARALSASIGWDKYPVLQGGLSLLD